MSRYGNRTRIACGIAITIAAILSSSAPAISEPEEYSPALEEALIQEFVYRVQGRFNVRIEAADYEVRSNQGQNIIARKDAPITKIDIVDSSSPHDNNRKDVNISPGVSQPPTPAEARRQFINGDVTIQQETAWHQPYCWSNDNPPVTDVHDAGWMDACWQWGSMNYSGATRDNWAFRVYATCKPGGANFFEVVGCYVKSFKGGGSDPLFWNDWSPKSTTDLGGCGQIQLEVGIGPVTGGATVSTCEKLVPQRGAAPADMRTEWVGDAYWPEDVRETGQIIGIGVAFNQQASAGITFGYSISSCTFGDITDLCG